MINYILQVVLFQTIFLALYDLFLQKETFFKWNRFYLIITPLLAFVIPLLKFDSLKNSVSQEYIEQLPTVFLNPQVVIEQVKQNSSSLNYLAIIFYSGAVLFTLLFLVRLTKLFKLIASHKVIRKTNYSLVLLEDKQAAFSFFNYIFINEKLLKSKDLQIIKHELIHCKQKHTVDLLFFELLKIILWFNPMVYVYQKRITLLHEYISDAEVIKETNKKTYFNMLLSETFSVENISFINQFFKHSLIKKRIVMITKEKSQKIKQLKYLLVLPLLVGMLFYSSCTDAAKDELLEMESILQQNEEITEGKYFDTKTGKIFIGRSLTGILVPFEEYTDKEKEMYKKTSTIENSIFEFQVIIDNNGDRIGFLKTNKNTDEYKNNWEYIEGEAVPFAKIENVPVFPGCKGTQEDLRICLQEKITAHVSSNFNSKLANGLGLKSGVKRIFVMFKIDKEGNITDAKSRAPHKLLADEALRVINLLPKMEPGKYFGENVGVKYSLPIAFKVEGESDGIKTTNLNTDEKPLYFLNGKEISKEELDKVNAKIIKSMNVIKREEAIQKYGDKGKNGAIEIILKK